MLRPSLLFVRIPSIPSSIESAWNRWYDTEHIAYRMTMPGFLGARRYQVADGSYRYLALYEIADAKALTTPEYLAHRQWEAARPQDAFEAIAPRLPGFARGVYEQHVPAGGAYRMPDADAALFGDLDGASLQPDALRTWFAEVHRPEILRFGNIRDARLLTLSQAPLDDRSGHQTAKPIVIVQYDLTNIEATSASDLRSMLLKTRHAARVLPMQTEPWIFATQVYRVLAPGF